MFVDFTFTSLSLQFTSLHFTSLHFTSLHFTSLHFTSLHFTSLHYTSLHFTSLHFTSLHFTSLALPFVRGEVLSATCHLLILLSFHPSFVFFQSSSSPTFFTSLLTRSSHLSICLPRFLLPFSCNSAALFGSCHPPSCPL